MDASQEVQQVMDLKSYLSGRATPASRRDIAEAFGTSKPTVAAMIAKARAAGVKIKTVKTRQGLRGPKAFSYYVQGE